MFKVLIADKNEERGESIAEELNRCGFSAAYLPPGFTSIRRYVKRHDPDAILIIYSFKEKKLLSLIDQAKKMNILSLVILEQNECCSRLVKTLADSIVEVKSFDGLCKNYAVLIEEQLSHIKHASNLSKGVSYGSFYVDLDKNIIYYGKKRLNLTPTEFQILFLLVMAKGQIVTKQEIMKQIWGISTLNTNALNVHIQKLKKNLSKEAKRYEIQTIRGKGYALAKKTKSA